MKFSKISQPEEILKAEWECCNCHNENEEVCVIGRTLDVQCSTCEYSLGAVDTSESDWEQKTQKIKDLQSTRETQPISDIVNDASRLSALTIGCFGFFFLLSIVSGFFLPIEYAIVIGFLGAASVASLLSSLFVHKRVASKFGLTSQEVKKIHIQESN